MGNTSSQLMDGTQQPAPTGDMSAGAKVEDVAGSPEGSDIVVDKPRTKSLADMTPKRPTTKKRKWVGEDGDDGGDGGKKGKKKKVMRGRPRDPSLLVKDAEEAPESASAMVEDTVVQEAELPDDAQQADVEDVLPVKKKKKRKAMTGGRTAYATDGTADEEQKENLVPDATDAIGSPLPKSSPKSARKSKMALDTTSEAVQPEVEDPITDAQETLEAEPEREKAAATAGAQPSKPKKKSKKKSKKQLPAQQAMQDDVPDGGEDLPDADAIYDAPMDDEPAPEQSRRKSRNNPHMSDDEEEYVPKPAASTKHVSVNGDAAKPAPGDEDDRRVSVLGKPRPRKRKTKAATATVEAEAPQEVSEIQQPVQENTAASPPKRKRRKVTQPAAGSEVIPDSQPQAEPSTVHPLDSATSERLDEVFAPVLHTLKATKHFLGRRKRDGEEEVDLPREILICVGDRITSCLPSDDEETSDIADQAWRVVADQYWLQPADPNDVITGQKLSEMYEQMSRMRPVEVREAAKTAAKKANGPTIDFAAAKARRPRASAARQARMPTPPESQTVLAQLDPTGLWDPERKPLFAELAVEYLLDLPDNAGKRLREKDVLEMIGKSAYFSEVCEALKSHGLQFDNEKLSAEVKKKLGGMGRQHVQTDDHVTKWLRGNESVDADPSSLRPQRRKRSVEDQGSDDASASEYTPEDEDPAPDNIPFSTDARREAPQTTRELNIERTSRVALPAPLEDGPSNGSFTDAEKRAADAVFDYICQQNSLKAETLGCDMIDWSNLNPDFKTTLSETLPKRTKTALRKFCRRRYIPKTTGPWTAEEDTQLLRVYQNYPGKWQEIADLMDDRTDQQCRDRWRDVLQYKGKMESGAWSKQEEDRLVGVVWECMEMVRKGGIEEDSTDGEESKEDEPHKDMKPEELEKLVAWNIVSEKMQGTRSRKRCYEKWQKLKHRNGGKIPPKPAPTATKTAEDQLLQEEEDADKQPAEPYVFAFDAQTKKQRAIAKEYDSFDTGDIYDAMLEIHTAIDDHTKVFHDESTLWSIVATKNKGTSRFNSQIRRRAFNDALDEYGEKILVRREKTIAGKARAIVEYLDGYRVSKGKDFKRGYKGKVKRARVKKQEVEVGGEGEGTVVEVAEPSKRLKAEKKKSIKERAGEVKKRTAERRKESAKKGKKFLSAERVDDSDVGDDEVVAAVSRGDEYERHGSNGYEVPAKTRMDVEADGDDHDDDADEEHDGQAAENSDDSSDEESSDREPMIPETQQDAEADASAEGMDDDIEDADSISSLGSRIRRRVSRPSLGREEFLQRCTGARRRRR